jgi:hypothetical protein
MVKPTRVAAFVAMLLSTSRSRTGAFTFQSNSRKRASDKHKHARTHTSLQASRRSVLATAVGAGATAAATAFVVPPAALAIPSVTVEEFESILRNSARSVRVVEFAGPRGDIVTVRLADGSAFAISDIIESSTDPRSPLKLAATLRGYKIPTKFTTFENALSSTPKKQKSYMNERVQEAAEKEREKKEREARDEEERLAELYKMEGEEVKRN